MKCVTPMFFFDIDCVKDQTDIVGGTLIELEVGLIGSCAAFCSDQPDCKFWTFDYGTMLCQLKFDNASEVFSQNKFSGHKGCQPYTPTTEGG